MKKNQAVYFKEDITLINYEKSQKGLRPYSDKSRQINLTACGGTDTIKAFAHMSKEVVE